MKTLTLILFFLPLLSLGQDTNNTKIINPIMETFYKEASMHGLYLESYLVNNLKGIYLIPTKEFKRYISNKNDNRAGTIAYYNNYLKDRKEVMILIDERFDPLDIEAFLYHELGHILGLEHSDGLMSEQINGKFLTPENIENYFLRIKATPPNKYRNHLRL